MVGGPVGAAPQGETFDLRSRVLWVMVFRTVASMLSLAAIGLRRWNSPGEWTRVDSLAFALVGAVFAATLAYAVSMRRGAVTRRFAAFQILGDVLLVSAVVFVTGGTDSPFTFTFPLAVVLGAITLALEGAMLSAAGTSIAFLAMVLGQQLGWVESPAGVTALPWSQVIFVSTGTVTAQFLVAALSGYLAQQLARAGGRITQRDERIRSLLELQREIVTAMPSGLLTCDAQARVTFANPAGRAILGLEGEVLGGQLADLMPGLELSQAVTPRTVLSVTTPKGKRTLGLSTARLPGAEGGHLVVFQDLTELQEKEEQLRRADHLASLGKLSAQLAHELRNPLAAMRGAAQLLGSAGEAEATPRLTQILVREADRLNVLVDDFLRFARPPPPRLAPVDLAVLANEVIELLRNDPLVDGVHLEVDAPGEVWAQADRGQLQQVLVNLVRNALAAVEHGGRVRVSARLEAQPTVVVWDSAGRIPHDALDRIFEPFFSLRPGGTGLGLSTAFSIVRAHGGDLRVRSRPDTGTEFRITLSPVTGTVTPA